MHVVKITKEKFLKNNEQYMPVARKIYFVKYMIQDLIKQDLLHQKEKITRLICSDFGHENTSKIR